MIEYLVNDISRRNSQFTFYHNIMREMEGAAQK